ncbi:Hypothetical predicted protein [Octopus vulgaris]|uniref:Mos1 transposase HTH domain-containing protein n=1 Tax=Octopus vulgaris TaxID=6645 RepID=A0AA36F241_OCTVU|nr:Hypothetical predicted protein [Octopus vulgaris]
MIDTILTTEGCKVEIDKSGIRAVLKFEFFLGNTASQTPRNINGVFHSNVVTQQTVSNWFAKFRSGNFDLTNEQRGQPETKVENDKLKAIVESDPSQSACELSLLFGVSKQTILTHLLQIGKMKKLDKWVLYEHKENQKQQRLEACIMLLSRHKNESFWN